MHQCKSDYYTSKVANILTAKQRHHSFYWVATCPSKIRQVKCVKFVFVIVMAYFEMAMNSKPPKHMITSFYTHNKAK